MVAGSAREPDLAFFAAGRHLGPSLLVARAVGPPILAYLSPLEREEAAATGLALVSPGELELGRRRRAAAGEGELLAGLLASLFERAGLTAGEPVALAGRWPAGALAEAAGRLADSGWRLVAGDRIARRLRKHKSPGQLAEARRVALAIGEAMRQVAACLAAAAVRRGELWLGGEPLTAGRLRGRVAAVFGRHRLEQPEDNILAAGGDAAVPHNQGRDERRLRAGEALVVDLFPRGLVFGDCTRTLCAGEAPAALAAAHRTVRAVLERSCGRAQVGSSLPDLHRAACADFAAAGWPTLESAPATERGYVHGLGHGVGFELHELPAYRQEAGEDGLLEEGDLFTLEPGLYDPAAGWGVRLEDLCCLGPEGLEDLTPLPYDLDPRLWGEP